MSQGGPLSGRLPVLDDNDALLETVRITKKAIEDAEGFLRHPITWDDLPLARERLIWQLTQVDEDVVVHYQTVLINNNISL